MTKHNMSAPASAASQENHEEREHDQDNEHRGSHLNQHRSNPVAPQGTKSKTMMTSTTRVTCKNKAASTVRATLTNTIHT